MEICASPLVVLLVDIPLMVGLGFFTIEYRIESRQNRSRDGFLGRVDWLMPLTLTGVGLGTLLILSSVLVLIGAFSLLWLAVAGSLAVTVILFVALIVTIHRFDPAKEAQKTKRKGKRIYYEHLPY